MSQTTNRATNRATNLIVLATVVVGLLAGCGEAVDTSALPAISDYRDWRRLDVTGDVPAHLDTYRIIYINDIAQTYAHAGDYPLGSVIVKEIREKDGGAMGELKYLAIMRRLSEGDVSVDLDAGWLFTSLSDINSDETRNANCWANCHIQAPYRGAWFDYGAK